MKIRKEIIVCDYCKEGGETKSFNGIDLHDKCAKHYFGFVSLIEMMDYQREHNEGLYIKLVYPKGSGVSRFVESYSEMHNDVLVIKTDRFSVGQDPEKLKANLVNKSIVIFDSCTNHEMSVAFLKEFKKYLVIDISTEQLRAT